MEVASATIAPSSSAQSASNPGTPYVEGNSGYQTDDLANSPLVLPSTGHAADMEVPDLTLERAVEEVDAKVKKFQ